MRRYWGFWVLLACTGCVPGPAAGAPQALSYQLVINNGTATVAGRVLAPAVLLDAKASPFVASAVSSQAQVLNEVPVQGAQVAWVDQGGNLQPGVVSVQSDGSGRFELHDLPIGKSGFVRARFFDAQGVARYVEAYARPDSASLCLDASLVTTLMAHDIANSGDAIPYFNMKGLAAVQTLLAQRLPGALAVAGNLQNLLRDLTAPSAPKGAFSTTADGFASALLQASDVQADFNAAVDTGITVTFSLKSTGINWATYPDKDAASHLMLGESEVSWGLSTSGYQSVSFYLNNTKIADAAVADGVWSSMLDTTRESDGAYVLSAIAKPKDAAAAPLTASTFVYLKNQLPVDGACSAP